MSEEEKPSDLHGTLEKIINEIDEFRDQYYSPLDHLEPKQVKYVQMQVTTNMGTPQIAKVLGISPHFRRKWDKDEHVQAYKRDLLKQYSDQEIVESAKRQTLFIREQMFQEIFDRFQDPNQAADEYFGDREVSVQERMAYMERFAKFTDFDKIMKLWEKTDKAFRLDSGQATERKDDSSLEYQVRARFSMLQDRKKDQKSLKQKALGAVEKGMSFEEFERLAKAESEGSAQDNPEYIEAEIVEDEEEDEGYDVYVEEWEIKRGK